jgi:hypothetical protein
MRNIQDRQAAHIHIIFQEYFRYKYANTKSKFAQHLVDNMHSIGPMENIIDSIPTTNKGNMLNTIEKFYIYKEARINNKINGKCAVQPSH